MIAKYSRELRFKWHAFVEQHTQTVKETCRLFGIQRKIYYYWYGRDHGKRSKYYHPRKSHPNLKLTADLRIYVEREKLKYNYGPRKMSKYLWRKKQVSISPTIIYRFYQKRKLIRKPMHKCPWYEPIKKPLTIVKPGEGVQVDIKYVYEQNARKYMFSVLDPYTEKYFFMIFDTKHSKHRITAHLKAEQFFGFKILSIQSDNGSENRGEYHNWLTSRTVAHYFIPKSSPYWNAEVERVHRTIDDEYYLNPIRIWKTPQAWLKYYNYERIHETLNYLTPHEKYLESVTIHC